MKATLRFLTLGLFLTLSLLLPASAAPAQVSGTPVSVAPIDDVAMAEGDTVTVDVSASDPDEETITLSATLPAFATLNPPTEGTGTLSTTITLTPAAGTAGTYDGTVTAASGEDTATESLTITVTGVGCDLEATASLIGKFNRHKKFVCFKVKPVEKGFDLLLVSLSSITLSFRGESIPAVRPTHLAFDCDDDDGEDGEDDGEDDDGEDDDGDDDDGEDDDGEDCDQGCEDSRHGHGDENGDGDCDEGCDGHGHGDDGGDCPEDCEPSHIKACFAMDDLLALFDCEDLPDSLVVATIEGELTSGERFVATIGGKHVEGKDKDDDGDGEGHRKGKLSLRIKPNPMNPKTEISFTLVQPGRVRVAIYDLGGRLVGTAREGHFPAGAHSITWVGSSRSARRIAYGVYVVSVETSSIREVQRVTVLK